jgi:hypothetical protein
MRQEENISPLGRKPQNFSVETPSERERNKKREREREREREGGS